MSSSDASRAKPVVAQAPWQVPTRARPEPTLRVYNSLTRTKVDFVTKLPGIVTWYNCGPTVYDASHMGHARNYMTQDIMRRILRDFFGYEVNFVMNITDVDDKIIVRARHSHLLTSFLSTKATSLSPALLSDVQAAWAAYVQKTLAASLPNVSPSDADALWAAVQKSEQEDPKWAEAQRAREEKWTMYLAAVKAGAEGIKAAEQALKSGNVSEEEARKLVESNSDAVGIWLDKQLGATVTDPAVFRDLAAFWEDSFFRSMSSLHVERPTTLTRVSEYMPEIVAFVERLVKQGSAYEANGDVWFDTTRFDGAKGGAEEEGKADWEHSYAKLQPWSKGNRELLEDGEGSLTSGSTKRGAADFALWKSSKAGEPAWDSPWGLGRPGWHIECSVMASAVLGSNIDVHSGGIDLAFPHHDNEIAQSECYHDCRQWVNYFLHTGHLHIEGLKMSKSLKNFITIDDAVARHSARQLRFAFLLQTWNAKLDFKEANMQEVRVAETTLNNFFANVNSYVAEAKADPVASDGHHHYEQPERDLLAKLEESQLAFREQLCDSFDTPKALGTVLDLVSVSNVYLSGGRSKVNTPAVAAVAEWVTRMLRMFGLGEGSPVDATGAKVVGWGVAPTAGQDDSADRETTLRPLLKALSTFRDKIRKLAMEGKPASEILALTDQLRDFDMVELGVALDDQEDGQARFKFVDPETLRKARDEKAAIAAEKLARKATAAAAAEAKRLEKLEKGRVAPQDMFRAPGGEYSQWDDAGLPTHDKEGVEVAKSKRKKLEKEQGVQKKLHEEFLKAQE
ncbi:hypothetical protein RQP46_003407 [Phenoliferia psychrophenolica]